MGFQCLLVVTVTQHPSVKLVSYCDDCSINPGAHRGFLRAAHCSLSRWLVTELCISVASRSVWWLKRSVCRWLVKGIIDLSLIAHSCRPEHLSPVHVSYKTSSSQVQVKTRSRSKEMYQRPKERVNKFCKATCSTSDIAGFRSTQIKAMPETHLASMGDVTYEIHLWLMERTKVPKVQR